jgi:uncharacterized protein (DUF1778 family)
MSSKNHNTERERVTARLSSHMYHTISLAADILGSNINQFLVQSSFEKANSVIENERIISLTSKDAEIFFQQIDNPPKANKKLRKALERYKESELYAQGGIA